MPVRTEVKNGTGAIKGAVRFTVDDMMDPIFREIERIFTDIGEKPEEKLTIVGSCTNFKRQDYGDLDVIFTTKRHTILDVERQIKAVRPNMLTKLMSSLNIVSLGIPWKDDIVQVDVIVVPNEDWGIWMFGGWAAPGEKGAHRNIALAEIAKNMPEHYSVWPRWCKKSWSRFKLNFTSGLYVVDETIISPKTGKDLKHPVEVDRRFVSDDPLFVSFLLTGEDPGIIKRFTDVMYQVIIKRPELAIQIRDRIVREGYSVPSILSDFISSGAS